MANTLALRARCACFGPMSCTSFSRLAYLSPLLPTRLPKVMSYQRPHWRPANLRLAAASGGQSLHFAGCSEYICGLVPQIGGIAGSAFPTSSIRTGTHLSAAFTRRSARFLSRLETIKAGSGHCHRQGQRPGRLILAGNHADRGRSPNSGGTGSPPHSGMTASSGSER